MVPDPIPKLSVGGTAIVPDATSPLPVVSESEPPPTAGVAIGDEDGQRLQIPKVLPGADVSPMLIPAPDPTQSLEERRNRIAELFPGLDVAESAALTEAGVMSLHQLQQLAVENSPVLRQAAADVERARGLSIQAGLMPNPAIGYQGDTIGTAASAGYNGVSFSQEFVTADKLELATAAKRQEVVAVEQDLVRARIQLATSVRSGFFKVLIAQQELEYAKALAQLSEESYQAQIDRVASGESAAYEPLQLRVNAAQAANAVVRTTNELNSAWRQLAAAMGQPQLARHRLTGNLEASVASVSYDTAVAVLQRHSDLQAATARIAGARAQLQYEEARATPNLMFGAVLQHDDTSPESDFSANLMLSSEFPVFNRNQGNIRAAHAGLVRAKEEYAAVQNRLLSELAERYGRYETGRVVSASYRRDVVPDQVRVYRGVYNNFLIDGRTVDFTEVTIAQQTLGNVVNAYISSLEAEWMSAVELAETLQVEDLMTMDGHAVAGTAGEADSE